ncbi:hypothetical protein FB451DRAFT_264387 [Mycena latifolia]|nr:hypothetical protein FB451DRAFT_264387 [Mycena latifolia]
MAETLQARLGRSSPGANLSPKKVWKKAKQKPYTDDHHDPESPAAAWSSHYTSPSFESDGGPSQSSPPSLIDRLGPKVAPPSQRRSLLERMELEGNETVEDADPGVVDSFGSNCMPVDAVPYSKVRREEDSEINTADGRSDVYHDPSEDSELMADIRHRSFAVRRSFHRLGVSFLSNFRLEPDSRGMGFLARQHNLARAPPQDLMSPGTTPITLDTRIPNAKASSVLERLSLRS